MLNLKCLRDVWAEMSSKKLMMVYSWGKSSRLNLVIQVSANINGKWSSAKGWDEAGECVAHKEKKDALLWGNPKYETKKSFKYRKLQYMSILGWV